VSPGVGEPSARDAHVNKVFRVQESNPRQLRNTVGRGDLFSWDFLNRVDTFRGKSFAISRRRKAVP
jgi:hypothetical protein